MGVTYIIAIIISILLLAFAGGMLFTLNVMISKLTAAVKEIGEVTYDD